MSYFPQRKSPRLQGYDYTSEVAYFVTVCAYQRLHLFGDIAEGEMRRSAAGDITINCWSAIPEHYADVTIDAFVAMPNHVHGVLFLHGDKGNFRTSLGRVINAYKGAVTARIRQAEDSEVLVWQGRYHDHIIRNEMELSLLRDYIENNPTRWAEDQFNGSDS